MFRNSELRRNLENYLRGIGGLDAVRMYAALYVGEVDDQLLNRVSLEIWHFEDGLIVEAELLSRLATVLNEFGSIENRNSFGNQPAMIGITGTSVSSSYDSDWSIRDAPAIVRSSFQFV